MPALTIQYTQGVSEEKRKEYRSKLLHGNKDFLFHDERNLVFYSTLVREWLGVIKRTYPELESEEGTITFKSSVKVLVHGRALRDTFERDFEEMKKNAQTQFLETTPQHKEHERPAPPERCLARLSKKNRKMILQANKDFLFHDKRNGEKFNLVFCSTLVREWLDVMKRKYPNLRETQQDNLIKLKSKEGTISFYCSVEVLVEGEELMERFEEGFEEMKQKAQTQSESSRIGSNGTQPGREE